MTVLESVLVFLVSCVGLCLSDVESSCKNFTLTDYSPETPSLVYLESPGRLANQIYTYAFLNQIALETGVTVLYNTRTKVYLENTFSNQSFKIQTLKEVFCDPRKIRFEFYHGSLTDFLGNADFHKGRVLHLYPAQNGIAMGGFWPSNFEQDTESWLFLSRAQETARDTLQFLPHIQKAAEETLSAVTQIYNKKSAKMEITFVGVHNRRTDHLQYTKRVEGKKAKQVKAKYFIEAMNYFRDEYDNTVFIFVSDDMNWGREKLKNDEKDLFFVGRGVDPKKAETERHLDASVDFAVLANCNHTIMTRGTYGLFASVFANGETYRFDIGPYMPRKFYKDDL